MLKSIKDLRKKPTELITGEKIYHTQYNQALDDVGALIEEHIAVYGKKTYPAKTALKVLLDKGFE